MKQLRVRTLEQWRAWLAKHHASESEVWLVFPKKHTGLESIEYSDALDEALCFGWVDSLVRRLDEDRFARKFTPRRADSRWSAVNRRRYAALEAAGRLRPPGLARRPTDHGAAPHPGQLAMPARLPAYIRSALERHPAARRTFDGLAPSQRRRYFAWIESAKREETKLRRLAEAIRLLERGEELGLK